MLLCFPLTALLLTSSRLVTLFVLSAYEFFCLSCFVGLFIQVAVRFVTLGMK